MKRILSALTVAAIATVALQSSASAAPKKPYIGPQVELNGLTGFGAIGRFPLSDDFSLRPAVTIFNGGALITGTVSYDFDTKSPLTPYVGIGYSVLTISGFGGVGAGFTGQAGVDYAISDSFDLNANLKFTGISVGAGFKF
jgi:Opacity family porin protein